MCLIGKPPPKKPLIWLLRTFYMEQWECGPWGSWAAVKTASLTLNDRAGFEILLQEHFPSPDITSSPHHPTSSPSLHFHVSVLACLVSLSYSSHSRIFLYILRSYFLYSSQAFMSLFLPPLFVSYSITIISIPSCSIYHRGYGALRHFFPHTCL